MKNQKNTIIQNQRQLNREVKRNDYKLQDFFEIKPPIRSNHLLTTTGQELYFLHLTPKNITVMSDNDITALEDNLSAILSSMPKCEFLALDSTQNYKENKKYLKTLADIEDEPLVAKLDTEDINHMDKIRLSMATSRIFYILLRCNAADTESEKTKFINDALQICHEHNFDVELALKDEIKKMLAIYLEQNVFEDVLPDYDGEQYGLDEQQSDELQLKNFVDLVAPSVMNFKHGNYYVIGNTFRSTYAVREYATSTKKLHLLSELGERDGVTLHIYNRLLSSYEQDKVFQQAERRNHSLFNISRRMGDKVKSDENLNDLEKLERGAHKTKEKFLNCAVYIEMIANSLDKLKELKTSVDQILSSNNIVKDNLFTQQRDGFVSAAPFGFNIFQKEFERVLPASSVGNLFPFSYSGKTDRKGIYIGKDVHGSNIIVDFDERNSDKTNGHIAILGNSGEGKSYLMKLLMCIFRQQQKKIFSCDVEDEYSPLVTALGGTNIDMMSGDYFINPMEPKMLLSDDEKVNKRKSMLSQHIAFVRAFFEVYNPELTAEQLDTLEILLEETYSRFEIDDNTDLLTIPSDKFPILEDLYQTAENALNTYDNWRASNKKEPLYTKEIIRSLTLALRGICVGSKSKYFNGHTNIPNINHVNFILKGMTSTNENLKNAMYFNVFSFMEHKYLVEGAAAVFIDELHEVIKSKIVVDYIRSFIKLGRKHNSNVVYATQNIDDLMLPGIIEYTRPLFSIPTHMFLFYPGKVNRQDFMNITGVSETEFSLFAQSKRGHCFYICGNEKYYIQIIVPPHKAVLFGNAGGN